MKVVFIFPRVPMHKTDLQKSNTIHGIVDFRIRIRDSFTAAKIHKKCILKWYLMNWSSPVLVFSLMGCHF